MLVELNVSENQLTVLPAEIGKLPKLLVCGLRVEG